MSDEAISSFVEQRLFREIISNEEIASGLTPLATT